MYHAHTMMYAAESNKPTATWGKSIAPNRYPYSPMKYAELAAIHDYIKGLRFGEDESLKMREVRISHLVAKYSAKFFEDRRHAFLRILQNPQEWEFSPEEILKFIQTQGF